MLLGLLGAIVCCWVFDVTICIAGSFTWQYVLLYVLGAMSVVVCSRW